MLLIECALARHVDLVDVRTIVQCVECDMCKCECHSRFGVSEREPVTIVASVMGNHSICALSCSMWERIIGMTTVDDGVSQ